MAVKLLQATKAAYPMVVTFWGIIIEDKARHRWYLQVTLYQHFIILTIEK